MRRGLAVAFIIVSYSSGGIIVTVREWVATSRSWVPSWVMELEASALDHRIEAPSGLVGLGSQGRGCATHPVASGAVHLSCQAEFG
jgi:hypothetical protein